MHIHIGRRISDKALIWKTPFTVKHDQITITVLFWYLVKIDERIRYCTIAYTGEIMFYKVPEIQEQMYHTIRVKFTQFESLQYAIIFS